MKAIGIIPARYASTRFPGKPLVDIQGMSMIERVYRKVEQSNRIEKVLVATDHAKIFDHVTSFGGEVIMTSTEHNSGTDRCAEAIHHISDYEIAVNIQGDEPFIDPLQIDVLVELFEKKEVQIATLVKAIHSSQELENPNSPKVVIGTHGEALYFSRLPIPYQRGIPKAEWHKKHRYYKHVGIYAFKTTVLKELTKLPPSALELAESLEQLRWLENGYKIQTAVTELESISIDRPEDLEKLPNLQ